jgi:hypothetical protein
VVVDIQYRKTTGSESQDAAKKLVAAYVVADARVAEQFSYLLIAGDDPPAVCVRAQDRSAFTKRTEGSVRIGGALCGTQADDTLTEVIVHPTQHPEPELH